VARSFGHDGHSDSRIHEPRKGEIWKADSRLRTAS
jgi:hypothetical protein